MPDLTLPPYDQRVVSRGLSAQAARIALRVAQLLEERCSDDDEVTSAAGFLRTWGDAALAGEVLYDSWSPFSRLVSYFGLSDAETDLLLLAGLPEEHEGLASTFRQMHPHGEPRPTVGLAALVMGAVSEDRTALRALLWSGPLLRHGLVKVTGSGTLFEQSIVLAERLWDALHGEDAWPATVERVPTAPLAPGLARWSDGTAVRRAVQAVGRGRPVTVLVGSADEAQALGRCVAVAERCGVPVVAARVAPEDAAAIGLVAAHAALRGALPVLVVRGSSGEPTQVTLAVGGVPGPVAACAPPGVIRAVATRPVLSLAVGPIATTDQQEAWRAAVPQLADQAPVLAARHPLDPTFTAQIALDLRSRDSLGVVAEEITDAIRARIGVRLPSGIELSSPRVAWERLIVPAEPAGQLREAVARLNHQALVLDEWRFREQARASRGVRLLFTGLPGTGKTLAAEAVAHAAQRDLLTVDVSQVVSKWIGETEKNLSEAFDAAEQTQAVLFLDEADALFGTRTQITDAHDRYANLETAYLLQRLDRFDGLAVLATNLRNNIDPAFIRRMDFVIEFPMPDIDSRRGLWDLHLPDGVVDEDVDLDSLARLYPVAGGSIRNAAIAAAFVAADEADRIHQHHLVAAMRREYAKAAQPFPGEPPRRRLKHV